MTQPDPETDQTAVKPQRKVGLVGALAGAAVAAIVGAMIAVVSLADYDQGPQPEPTPTPTVTALPSPPPPPSGTPTPSAGAPGLPGQAVRDGDLEFVVHEHECGREAIGNEFYEARAQGMFCLVELTVRNISAEPATFDGGAQQGFDSAGRRYAPDPEGDQAANWATTINESINPGNHVRGFITFDVPKGTTLAEVELHDSLASQGAVVQLS